MYNHILLLKRMKPEEEIFLASIKSVNLELFGVLLKATKKFAKQKYPNHTGFLRNGADGCYEMFLAPKEQEK